MIALLLPFLLLAPGAAVQDPESSVSPDMLEQLRELMSGAAETGSYYAGAHGATGGARPADPFRRLDDLLPTPTRTRNASGAPGPDYWQQRVDYRIRVRLEESSGRLDGVEDVVYHNHSPDVLDFLWVQLDDNWLAPDSLDVRTATAGSLGGASAWNLSGWFQRRAFDGSVHLHEVSADGRPLEHFVHETMMRIELPQPLAPGASFEFRIAWSVTINPAGLADSRAGFETFGDASPLVEAAHWYPRLCVYDDVEGWQNKQFLGNGEFALEFGDFEVAITVPADHVVAATGTLQNAEEVLDAAQRERWARAMTPGGVDPVMIVTLEEAQRKLDAPAGGEKTWRFAAANVRDFAWASSRRFLWDCLGVQLRDGGPVIAAQSFWPPEGEPLWSRFSTRAVAHTLRVYSRMTFDYPYPSAASVNGPVYGMEYPMICFNSPRPSPWSSPEDDEHALVGVVIHEVGHNWFPMIVNSDERQWTWMDEGLNSFVESIASREWSADFPLYGGDAAAIAMQMADPGAEPLMTASDSTANFGWNGYAKPSAGLHLLRNTVMGEDLFDLAFRTYAERWKFKRPQPADFFRTMEDASAVDLDWFWRAWFYETGYVDFGIRSFQELPAEELEQAGAPIGTRGYVLSVGNDGTMIAPLVLELLYEDGETETRLVPVEVWRHDSRVADVIVLAGRPLARITLDPSQLTYDVFLFDNAAEPGFVADEESVVGAEDGAGDPYEIPLEDDE
jgi:hypothetical protein